MTVIRVFLTPRRDQQEFTVHRKYLSRGKRLLGNFTTNSRLEIRKLCRSGFISGSHVIFTRIKLKGSHMRGIYCDTV